MQSFKKPDGSYLFDITRSGNIAATLLGSFRRGRTSVYSVFEQDSEIVLKVGDTSKDVPLDQLPCESEMSIPREFYDKAVMSAYADEIVKVVPTISGLDEFSKFFSYSGNLLGVQLALLSNDYYGNEKFNFDNLKISELLNSTFNFQSLFMTAYKNFLISNELVTEEEYQKDYLFLDVDTMMNYLSEMTRNKPSVSGETVKNRFPIVLAMTYLSLFQTLCGSILAIVGGMGQNIKTIIQITQNVSVNNVIGMIANNQLDMFNEQQVSDGLSGTKKILLGLLATFYRLHTFVVTYTGYDFTDPMATTLAAFGKAIYEASPDDYDDLFIDRSILTIGEEFGVSIEALTDIVNPVFGYNTFGVHYLEHDSVLPFAMVSAFHLFMINVNDSKRFYKNSFVRVNEFVKGAVDAPENEVIVGMGRTLVADAQADASEVDVIRFFKVASVATYLRDLNTASAKEILAITDNYLTALYIKWFKSGKFYTSARKIDGGGLKAYHELHKEILMIISYYQEYLTSKSQNMSADASSFYTTIALSNLAYQWINDVPGEVTYIQTFITSLKNITIAMIKPEDFARSIFEGSISAVTAEVIGIGDHSVSIVSMVSKYNDEIGNEEKGNDIEAIKAFQFIDDSPISDLRDCLKASDFEQRCFVLGSTVSQIKGIAPIDYVTYFVAIPIETLLKVWDGIKNTFIEAKGLIQKDQVDFLEIGSTFIEGGTAETLFRKAAEFNPMKR